MTVSQSMLAWQVASVGEPVDVLTLTELPVPTPGPGQALVEVWSSALTGDDVLLARGLGAEQPSQPFTPGAELCGMVVAVGAGVERTRVGERVIGTPVLPHGALARYAVLAEADLLTAPPGLDDASASAMHIAYQTGWFGLYRRASLRVGEILLVNAAAGGVGSAAVQLGKAAGARVIGVVGAATKKDAARSMGADLVLERSDPGFADQVLAFSRGRGVDVVYDPVGGPGFAALADTLAFEGRAVVVGFAAGQITRVVLDRAVAGGYGLLGLNWNRYRTHDPRLIRRAHDDLRNLVEAGGVRPLVSERLVFEQAAQGLARVAAGLTVGRLTVQPPT